MRKGEISLDGVFPFPPVHRPVVVVMRAVRLGITCEVSFHGHSRVNIELDIAVADATELVSPTRQ